MTKCEKILPHLPDVIADELLGDQDAEIREHLAACGACRAKLESARRLQNLLALKRAERPDEFFLRNFVPEFHRRLMAEMVRKTGFWEQLGDILLPRLEPLRGLFRYSHGFAAVATLVILCGLYAVRFPTESVAPQAPFHPAPNTQKTAGETVVEVPSQFTHLIMANNPPDQNRVYVMDRVDYKLSAHEPVVVQF